MEIRWKLWTRCLIAAGALLAGTQVSQADETETDRELLSWTLIAARPGEPGQLGVKLRGQEKATLDAWIDFDGDGFFNEAEERVLDRAAIEPGMSIKTFELPPEAALSASSRIRFRVDDLEGEKLMEREALAFPERIVDPGCNWAPGFGNAGLNDHVYALEVFDGALYAGGNFNSLDGTIASWRSARWDGRGWQALSGFEESTDNVLALQAFDDGNGPRLYAGTGFAPYLFRLNGTAWEPIPGIANGRIQALAAWDDGSGPALYVGGSFVDADGLANADRIVRWTETDGWQALGTGRSTHVNTLEVLDLGSGSLLYVGGGNDGTSFVASWNGQAWQSLGNPGEQVYDLEKFGSSLHAGGEFGVKSWNGSTWATVGSLTGNVRSLEVFDAGAGPALYAGGDALVTFGILPMGKLARWNGSGWTALARFMNNSIYALENYAESTGAAPALFAGGSFSSTNSTPAVNTNNLVVNFIARFDAVGFSSLSSGIHGYVMALEADPTRNRIYAAGEFSHAGGLVVSNFARWDGQWRDVGGTGRYGRDILIDNSTTPETIYVATQGESDFGKVSQLQGTQWTDLTTGMNNDARALAIYGGKLYMGGSYSSIEPRIGNPQFLASFNGNAWTPVGTGTINNEVNALTVFDFGPGQGPRLVVGGRFTSRVAAWDGSTWSTLPGLSNDVNALAIHDRLDGQGPQLYAGGANFIARWTGSQWSVFGSVTGTVLALQSFSDGTRPLLAAGGTFGAIGGVPYIRFAVWDGQGWNAVGSGFNEDVWSLTTLPSAGGDRLYAGGEFTTANGLSSAAIARLECPAPIIHFDATITKTSATTSTPVSIGDSVPYQIEVRNEGPAVATGVVVEDVFSNELQGCSWTASATGGASGQQSGSGNTLRQTLSLPVGAQVSYVISCTVAPSAEGTIDNVATLDADLDTHEGNNGAEVTHTVLGPGFDATITKTGKTSEVSHGEEVVYVVEVRNQGPAAASGVVVEDDFPSTLRSCRWTAIPFGGATGQQSGSGDPLRQTLSLPVGAQVSYIITCTIDASAQGTIVNAASLTATFDTVPGNNHAQVSHTVLPPVITFDVAITKTSKTSEVSHGEEVGYVVEVLNRGPAAASGVVVEDDFPDGLRNCSWTAVSSGGATGQQSGFGDPLQQTLSLPAGAQVNYVITCIVDISAQGTIVNTASLMNATLDTDPGNNQAQVSHVVREPTDFDAAITMTSAPTGGVSIGEDVVYRIEVRNHGPAAASAVTVQDDFPDGLRNCRWTAVFSGATGQQSGNENTLEQTLNLPPAAQVSYTITCTVADSAAGTIVNIAWLAATGDINPGNDQARVSHTVLVPIFAFDAAITMTSPSTIVSAGEPVKYQIEVRNHGPVAATGLKVEDVFPAALVSCAWLADGSGGASGHQIGDGQTLSQTLNLPPNAGVTYEVTCTFAGSSEGILENSASLPPGDLVPANNRAVFSHVVHLDGDDLYGDCNDNGVVDAFDFDAFHSEIFDGDGAFPEFTPAPDFPGHPIGCNANEDATVDAGDLACLARKLQGQTCLVDALPAPGLPRLSMPDLLLVTNRQILVPISLDAAQQGINTVAFELHYESSKVDLAPGPNAIVFHGVSAQASIHQKVDRVNHRIEVVIRQPFGEQLASGQLATLTFNVAPSHLGEIVQRAVTFSTRTAASFGNTKGQGVVGLATLHHAIVRTLVVTHTSRLLAQPDLGFGINQQARLKATLESFLNHDRVNGMLVDLSADPDLRWLYQQWDDGQPDQANAVLFGGDGRRGLHPLLLQLQQVFPSVQHLLLIGDDRIVPFARLSDTGELSEIDYVGAIGSNGVAGLPAANPSTVSKALAADYFLSDDPLASREPVAASTLERTDAFVLPGLGVGRLVENAGEILGALDNFLERDGLLDLQTFDPGQRQVVVAGYDFSIDSAAGIGERWRTALQADPRSSTPVDDDLIGNLWQDDDLFATFAEGRARVYSLNGHASHELVGSPRGAVVGAARGLPALDLYGADQCGNESNAANVDLRGAVVIGMSCHGGLPVPGTCADAGSSATSHTLDLPQTFLARGALAYGDNSGFGWGLLEGTGLGERLALLFHEGMTAARHSPNSNVLGTILRQAKLDYYLRQLDFDIYDRKSLMQWTLYGFPMIELALAQDSGATGESEELQFGQPEGDGWSRALRGGTLFERRDRAEGSLPAPLPPYLTPSEMNVTFPPGDYHRVELGSAEDLSDEIPCPEAGCYWQLTGLSTDEVDLPMQPFLTFESTLAARVQRGVLWKGSRLFRREPVLSGGGDPDFERPGAGFGHRALADPGLPESDRAEWRRLPGRPARLSAELRVQKPSRGADR